MPWRQRVQSPPEQIYQGNNLNIYYNFVFGAYIRVQKVLHDVFWGSK